MNRNDLFAKMVELFTNTLAAVRSGANRGGRAAYKYAVIPTGKASYRFVSGGAKLAATLAAAVVVVAVCAALAIRALDSDSVDAEIEHGHVDENGIIVADDEPVNQPAD